MIPYGRQSIDQEDIDAVVDVLKSDFLTQGPITPVFEKTLSEVCESKYATAVVNATSALHISCLALGVGKGDIVWTSSISFVASANCAVYCGASIDFVDIDPKTYNMSIQALEKKLIFAKKNKSLPKVVIPVHLSGQSCDMKKIKNLSNIYKFKIIEDASHAIGGEYLDRPIGNCMYSDITVFSFHPVKIITTAEGGACTTNSMALYDRLCSLRSHGIYRNPEDLVNSFKGQWYYEQIELGYNYRLNDIQAALGLSQLKKLKKFVKKRHEIALYYEKLLKDLNYVKTPFQSIENYSSYHLYIIRIINSKNSNRKEVFEKLRSNGILANLHYIPIYRQPYYSKNFNPKEFPNSESYYEEAISIPIHPALKVEDIDFIVNCIKKPINHQNLF